LGLGEEEISGLKRHRMLPVFQWLRGFGAPLSIGDAGKLDEVG
jgi:hypothetical protein